MYDKRSESDALHYGILDRMQALEDDLSKIPGIVHTEFDIRDFGEIRHVILVPKYHVPVTTPNYFKVRRQHLKAIFDTCEKHGLLPSGDTVEDMGEHWYIVRTCDKTWLKVA